jgi:hypothetical protein
MNKKETITHEDYEVIMANLSGLLNTAIEQGNKIVDLTIEQQELKKEVNSLIDIINTYFVKRVAISNTHIETSAPGLYIGSTCGDCGIDLGTCKKMIDITNPACIDFVEKEYPVSGPPEFIPKNGSEICSTCGKFGGCPRSNNATLLACEEHESIK